MESLNLFKKIKLGLRKKIYETLLVFLFFQYNIYKKITCDAKHKDKYFFVFENLWKSLVPLPPF